MFQAAGAAGNASSSRPPFTPPADMFLLVLRAFRDPQSRMRTSPLFQQFLDAAYTPVSSVVYECAPGEFQLAACSGGNGPDSDRDLTFIYVVCGGVAGALLLALIIFLCVRNKASKSGAAVERQILDMHAAAASDVDVGSNASSAAPSRILEGADDEDDPHFMHHDDGTSRGYHRL